MGYTYPFDSSWSKEEIINVIQFFTLIEKAYETGVDREILNSGYRKFKRIVPSKSEEKKLFDSFEKESGYSAYRTMKKVKEVEAFKVKM